ncbi:MAG TPA: hypothetical protein IGS17_20570 [Oscillatoriales cyanobacterium M59_W2019_021]|nr:hypothetical protein [Oscillatoriales cyanobacterium M4454_W2019_049]HIK53289.1 hypothetical protein [Oscillatoriales cyanobacterium M59_W2019_021]
MTDSKNNRWKWVGIAGWTLLSLGIAAVIIMLTPALANWHDRILAKLALILTAILPPLWFWIEYCFIWNAVDETCRPSLEEFKYGQEVSRNIWLAFVALLTALYFQ